MTCIAGVTHAGHVWLGGDSCLSSKHVSVTTRDPKVFRCGPIIVGWAGAMAWGALWKRVVFNRTPAADLDTWIHGELREAVARELPEDVDGTALIGLGSRLYVLESDGSIYRPAGNYAAIGTGESVALGSLHTTARRKLVPRYRLNLALSAAAAHTPGVSAPFKVIHT